MNQDQESCEELNRLITHESQKLDPKIYFTHDQLQLYQNQLLEYKKEMEGKIDDTRVSVMKFSVANLPGIDAEMKRVKKYLTLWD